ncbi:DNA/RNA polymerase [Mytilinidion resinicola]|uniref:DNA/RNA polymerase n=1 Tax=Mytilinidion resinicola TaxID=574789 RepID=A0A6A6YJN5_9PEZI|nr:DNA/RNA polymerase [Mytilinidion resinicola]KAF2808768.1 DNA/RNA polymerase [Mytilinidion resinicola]
MQSGRRSNARKRPCEQIIIHFDYDCFYASVFEAETPALRSLPLAVQQKQIIATCNYEARRRGLRKLQPIKEARKICPDVVIVLGEDLTRFRNASKDLYSFLRAFSWNAKVERLGFDEVFMDVSDIVDYNLTLLNPNDLANSFFCLSKADPTQGFAVDASQVAGHTYPGELQDKLPLDAGQLHALRLRLHLGSHLAMHLRHQLEQVKDYTCTVGISTSKLLAKLVGNLNKPKGQTTLMPPYNSDVGESDNVTTFVDSHEVGKIPGIGFKLAQKIREHVLRRPAEFDNGFVYGGTKEQVLVRDVRTHPGMNAEVLEKVLGGPGTPHGIGGKIWGLVNGVDETEVGQAREVPKQISIEDSYMRLDTMEEVLRELHTLTRSLITRMRIDLLEDDDELNTDSVAATGGKRWIAHPKTLRLSSRPRPPLNADGTRTRTFNRISRSAPSPNFIFNLTETVDNLAEKLVAEVLLPLFRKLHPEKSGWNLSLMNIAITNMEDTASDTRAGTGRNIARMFKQQDDVLKQWRVEDRDRSPSPAADATMGEQPDQEDHLGNKEQPDEGVQLKSTPPITHQGSEDIIPRSQDSRAEEIGQGWDSDEEMCAFTILLV